MKKNIAALVLILLITVLVIPLKGIAADNIIKITIDNKMIEFNKSTGYPFTDSNGRTQVPFRITLEKFGAKVDWDQAKSTAVAEKDNVKVEVPIGQKYIIKNGDKIVTDTAALIKDDKTYLPIRAVIEALGGTVAWDNSTKTVAIESIKNNDILVYNIPKELGQAKLTKEEVNELVGKDPSVIQNKISTVPDLIQYMISAGYDNSDGDTQLTEGSLRWHFNRPAESTLKLNEGDCGATANIANYILKGDYDEVGFIVFSADSGQGGHVFNYIKQAGKYYFVDFLQYPLSDYKRYNYEILSLDRLEDYPDYCKRAYSGNGQKFQIKIIVAYTAETNLPIANNARGSEYVMRYLPKGYDVKVLYQTSSEGKIVEFVNPPTTEPNWNN